MKHLGDITKIKGCTAPVVDCIIGGSPCQDLSLAGKRAGLAGARSGLYMEQIRICKEMRHEDELRGRTGESIRPRYMVWENVPGAFSTNQGQDFAAVLEEAIRVAEPEAPDVPVPEKGWPTCGCIMGERWSVAWRVLDAQFWGTSDKPLPQRRRRIALVADFGGRSAPEILFVRQSVSGDLEPGEPKRKETAGDVGEGAGGAIGCDVYNLTTSGDKAVSLNTNTSATGAGLTVMTLGINGEIAGTLDSSYFKGCGMRQGVEREVVAQQFCVGFDAYNQAQTGDVAKPLTAAAADSDHTPVVFQPIAFQGKASSKANLSLCEDISSCLVASKESMVMETYQKVTGPLMANSHPGSYTGQDAFSDMLVAGVDCRNATEIHDKSITLQSSMCHNLNSGNVVRVKHIVRRLTPLEGERLQGFPDLWTALPKIEDMSCYEYSFWTSVLLARAMREGKARENENGVIEVWQFIEGEDEEDEGEWVNTHKPYKHKTKEQLINWYNRMIEADSSRYKALGNSIAIPPWKWVLKRLCACYERDATMASLFDGIGGFPYIWEQLNGKGSCLWASEIEEFPMAVTKVRFGE